MTWVNEASCATRTFATVFIQFLDTFFILRQYICKQHWIYQTFSFNKLSNMLLQTNKINICHIEITFCLKTQTPKLVSSHRVVRFSSPYLWAKLTRTHKWDITLFTQIPPFRHLQQYVVGQSVRWLGFRFMTRDRSGLVVLTVAFSVSSHFHCFCNFFRILSKWWWVIGWVDEIFT